MEPVLLPNKTQRGDVVPVIKLSEFLEDGNLQFILLQQGMTGFMENVIVIKNMQV